MLNPSYLIKSRHDIYYFRYPLPVEPRSNASRVSVSLKTRCPKKALRLARALEYHSIRLIDWLDTKQMNHAEIMSVFKSYFAEVLERSKARIDADGPLPQEKVLAIQRAQEMNDSFIEGGCDDLNEWIGSVDDDPESSPIHKDLQPIMKRFDLHYEIGSKEYQMMKSAHKYAIRNHFNDLLAYNSQVMDYSLLNVQQSDVQKNMNHHDPANQLAKLISVYLDEIKPSLVDRSFNEQRDCLKYLTDMHGSDYPVTKIDNAEVQEIKRLLQVTPKNRNKAKITAGKPLTQQIAIAEDSQLPVLGITSVNKYLGYFDVLFAWASNNNYVESNPFKGIRVKAHKKKQSRRDNFTKAEVAQIIEGLGDGTKNDLVKHDTYYWGTLIAIYTGARRNEIASLLPDDIKKDETSGIWYFDITDEEEGKQLKTEAAKRIIPIHSRLIKLGFLDYVNEARKVIKQRPLTKGHETRLLHDLAYTEHDQWGRKLGRWFNDTYLAALGLKTNKKMLHSLRHSFITNLSAAGVEQPHVKAIVGHAASTVTDQTYTHYGLDHLPAFSEAIEKLKY